MATYTKISTIIVPSGGTSTIDFQTIPQTYDDLILMVSARNSYAGVADDILLRFNNTTTLRTSRYLYGNGGGVGSSGVLSVSVNDGIGLQNSATSTASSFGSCRIQITQYRGSNYKSITAKSITTTATGVMYQVLAGGIWSSTSGITSIQLVPASGTFVEHSSASLYGISNL